MPTQTLETAEFSPKIFGVGLSKTGTTSLYAALMLLGIRAVTYDNMLSLGLDDWRTGEFITDYLKDVDAATDIPIPTYFRELDALYPGSKFILTERALQPWLRSVMDQYLIRERDAKGYRRDMRFATYGIGGFNAERFARISAEHSDAVRGYFADRPQDLLVMNVFDGSGWPELCGFLGHPIPDEPFPDVKPGFRIKCKTPDPKAPLLPFQSRR